MPCLNTESEHTPKIRHWFLKGLIETHVEFVTGHTAASRLHFFLWQTVIPHSRVKAERTAVVDTDSRAFAVQGREREKKDFFDKIEKGVTNDKTGDGQNQGSNKGKQVWENFFFLKKGSCTAIQVWHRVSLEGKGWCVRYTTIFQTRREGHYLNTCTTGVAW